MLNILPQPSQVNKRTIMSNKPLVITNKHTTTTNNNHNRRDPNQSLTLTPTLQPFRVPLVRVEARDPTSRGQTLGATWIEIKQPPPRQQMTVYCYWEPRMMSWVLEWSWQAAATTTTVIENHSWPATQTCCYRRTRRALQALANSYRWSPARAIPDQLAAGQTREARALAEVRPIAVSWAQVQRRAAAARPQARLTWPQIMSDTSGSWPRQGSEGQP